MLRGFQNLNFCLNTNSFYNMKTYNISPLNNDFSSTKISILENLQNTISCDIKCTLFTVEKVI